MLIAESGDANFNVLRQRADWERSRRSGRSRRLQLVTDGWRDSAGKLYQPNTLVPLDFPALKLAPTTWLISDVTYKRDANTGTTCELVIMPPTAFEVQPILLVKALAEVPAAAGK